MSPHEQARLERVETFIARLKMGSYIAKAAGSGERVLGDPRVKDAAEQRLASAATYADDLDDQDHQLSVLNDLRERIKQLESLWRVVIAPTLGEKTSSPVAQGESVLAKAVSAFDNADSLMAYADRTLNDPTEMGIIAGHISAGDLKAAKNALLEIGERNTLAKAPDVMSQVVSAGSDDDLAGYDSRAATSEMIARFGKLEQLLSSLEARLSQLEGRPQAAAPVDVDDGEIMAKAVGGKKRKRTPAEEADYLTAQVDSYFDNPTTVGQLTSMIASGQYKAVRSAVSRAKQAHESARLVNERKGWS